MRCFFVTNEFVDPRTLKPVDGGLAQYLCKITQALRSAGCDVGVVCLSPQAGSVVWNGVLVRFVTLAYHRRTRLQRLLWPFLSAARKKDIVDRAMLQPIADALLEEHRRSPIDIVQYASCGGMGRYPVPGIPSCTRISSYSKLWLAAYGLDRPEEVANENAQFRASRYLYGPSRAMARCIREDLGLKQEIAIIETPFVPYSGREDPELVDRIAAETHGRDYLLFFGSVGPLKGACEIADAVHEVLSRHPDLDLVLVGKATQAGGRSCVETICANAGEYADRVHWYDRQPHASLMPVIRRAKAVLLPSRFDNLPNTCIESMGLGKVVIGSRGASFEQLIDDGVSGLLCEAGNAASIVTAVDRLMALPPDEIAAMGGRAKARAATLSVDQIVPQVLSYYKTVIGNWRSR